MRFRLPNLSPRKKEIGCFVGGLVLAGTGTALFLFNKPGPLLGFVYLALVLIGTWLFHLGENIRSENF